jgi:hypothetical protein
VLTEAERAVVEVVGQKIDRLVEVAHAWKERALRAEAQLREVETLLEEYRQARHGGER